MRPLSARTKHPNTPESDQKPEVMHVVTMDNGDSLELMASDPSEALARVKRIFAAAINESPQYREGWN